MEKLWLIFLIAGLSVLAIYFLLVIYKIIKDSKVFTLPATILLTIGLAFVCGSLLITIMSNNTNEKAVSAKIGEQMPQEENIEDEYIDSSQPISGAYEPKEIARVLVNQEMEKREMDAGDWEITELEIYSDKTIDNLADYSKPVGKMRVVWVTGYVSGINDVGNIDLELYKLEGDDVWYIDNHWGVLRAIDVPEMPKVDESSYQLSTSDQLPTGGNSGDEPEWNDQTIEDDQETSEYFAGLEERFFNYLYEHFEEIGLINYLEDEKFYIEDTKMFQTPPAISDRREYTYYLSGNLTNDFTALQEEKQYELLSNIYFGESQFYEGHMFDVISIDLTIGPDLFTRNVNTVEKNGERFIPEP